MDFLFLLRLVILEIGKVVVIRVDLFGRGGHIILRHVLHHLHHLAHVSHVSHAAHTAHAAPTEHTTHATSAELAHVEACLVSILVIRVHPFVEVGLDEVLSELLVGQQTSVKKIVYHMCVDNEIEGVFLVIIEGNILYV